MVMCIWVEYYISQVCSAGGAVQKICMGECTEVSRSNDDKHICRKINWKILN